MRREVKWGLLGLIGVLGIAILSMSWFTVPEGYVSVVARNGRVIAEAGPGLNFKIPFFDVAYDMSVQNRRVDFEGVQSYSKDIQQSTSFVSVNFQLLPSSVRNIYSTVGMNYEGVLLNTRVYKHVKEVFGKHNARDIINQREIVSNEVEAALAAEMSKFGILVTGVQISNIDFSDVYEHAAEQAQVAQAQVIQAQQQLEKAKVDAQVQVANAEAAAQATKAKADAEAYRVKAEGDAAASVINARGSALRANPEVLELTRIERWKGEVPTTMIPGSTVPFINLSK